MRVKFVHDVHKNSIFHASANMLAQDIIRGGLPENGVSETKWTRGAIGAEKAVTKCGIARGKT